MASSLPLLLRLRTGAREESQALLRRAEDERDAQAARLAALRQATKEARENVDPTDPFALSTYHALRQRQEVSERRDVAKLLQREREVEQKRGIHVGRVRDELAMKNVIEAHEAAAAHDAAQRDGRRMDEIASRRRRDD